MSFLRPEVRSALWRWREGLAGGAMMALGVWWLIGPGRLLVLPALGLMLLGGALLWVGVQRARFRSAGQGPGAVQVDEGQITYFGPLTGGAVALGALAQISLDKGQYPAHWRLEQPGQADLMIPVNANGAEALFDAFATLPGLRTERMLQALHAEMTHAVVIWQRDSLGQAPLRMH